MLQSHRHFLRAVCGRNPQVCRQNCNSMCHTVGDISTSGLDGHIAISGCPSMSYLFVGTFFDFGVVENFVFRARITVILTSDSFGCMSLWLWLCSISQHRSRYIVGSYWLPMGNRSWELGVQWRHIRIRHIRAIKRSRSWPLYLWSLISQKPCETDGCFKLTTHSIGQHILRKLWSCDRWCHLSQMVTVQGNPRSAHTSSPTGL